MKRQFQGTELDEPASKDDRTEESETSVRDDLPPNVGTAAQTPATPPTSSISQNPRQTVFPPPPMVPLTLPLSHPTLETPSQLSRISPPKMIPTQPITPVPPTTGSTVSFSLGKKASIPKLQKTTLSAFSQEADDGTPPTTSSKPVVQKKKSIPTPSSIKLDPSLYDDYFVQSTIEKPTVTESIKKITWSISEMCDYTISKYTKVPGGAGWQIVEPVESEWCLVTSNAIAMRLEKQLTIVAVRKYVGDLIKKGWVSERINYVVIASAGLHKSPETPSEEYHWTLTYASGTSVLKPDIEGFPIHHVPMSPNAFWEKLEEMVTNEGLGTTDTRSVEDHIRTMKQREFKAVRR